MSSGGRLDPELVRQERELLGRIEPIPMSSKRRCPKPSDCPQAVPALDPLLPMTRTCVLLLLTTEHRADANSKPRVTAASQFDTSRLPLAVASLSPHR